MFFSSILRCLQDDLCSVVVLDVKDLDVEVEVVTACARCLLVVLLLDISSQGTASCSPFSFTACC